MPIARFHRWRRDLRDSLMTGIGTPRARRRARHYMLWFDHEIVRLPWSNFARVAEGVYRSNNPTHARLRALRDRGVKTIVNLRGAVPKPPYWFEEESCRELGLTLVNAPLAARHAPPRENILNLLEIFRTVEKPFLMHCKSGADRAGFASAAYLLAEEGASVAEARRMLSPRFVHFKWTTTGILDHILDSYEARNDASPIRFEDWIASEYDAEALQAEFDRSRA